MSKPLYRIYWEDDIGIWRDVLLPNEFQNRFLAFNRAYLLHVAEKGRFSHRVETYDRHTKKWAVVLNLSKYASSTSSGEK